MAKLDDHLKAAIIQMPPKEKDKLLLRLVAKDKKLVQRLIFELLEGSATRDSRAAAIHTLIDQNLPDSTHRDNSPGMLLMDLRALNGQITAHVNTTKDKPGEVILGAFLLAEAIRRNEAMLIKMARRADKIAPYMAKRASDLLKKAAKIHEDYYMEFRDNLNEILQFLHQYPPAKLYVAALNLPRRWDG
jgi:hypothetical protein